MSCQLILSDSLTTSRLCITLGVKEEELPENLTLTDASHLATLASRWSSRHQGLPLRKLPLYSVTVSEILRLHLLSSGARINDNGSRWR